MTGAVTTSNRADVFIVAGEASGDELGAPLMAAMLAAMQTDLTFQGVGGPRMQAEGLQSLFPMADIAVMGIGPVLARLPTLIERINRTARAAIAARPRVVVLIDSPDFTHRVAARIKRVAPETPIVIYVSPTVWVWRQGRAAKMARFTDRLLALLPFEPEVHARLGGPQTHYVGHPFIEKLDRARPAAGLPRPAPAQGRPFRVVVLPGSRRSEISRLIAPFGEVLRLVQAEAGPLEVVLPVVDHVRDAVVAGVADWPVRPLLVYGEAAKLAAFAAADAALAASGTVTLELGLAGVPTVAAYRLDWIARRILPFIQVPASLSDIIRVRSALLPNIIVGDKRVPEFIDSACQPPAIAAALAAILVDGPARQRQLEAFERLETIMRPGSDMRPSQAAAAAVIEVMRPA